MTVQELADFENSVAAEYERGEIQFPIHLSSGNERQLIDIFKEIRPCDAIFGAWRFHLHCLLKGVPPEELRQAIRTGKSIALTFPKHQIWCSAIVGGILPLAVGYALAIKRRGGNEKVWVFCGDMTAESGIFHECFKYAHNFELPIQFIIENNGLSVKTVTAEAWGQKPRATQQSKIIQYNYQSRWPHSGVGRRIDF